jgi:dGTPase
MHDIGHPPYGHAGEDVLNDCIKDEGGFSHNDFALTIVRELEFRYKSIPGLNLTYESLQGQTHRIEKKGENRPLLEVQLVDAADSTTYDAHDTDDALKLGLVTLDEMAENQLIRDAIQFVKKNYTDLTDQFMRQAVVHRLIDRQVTDLIDWCGSELVRIDFPDAQAARASDFEIGPSPELAEQKKELETFLYDRVYRHPRLLKIREQAQQRLRKMYEGFVMHPELFPDKYNRRAKKVGNRRMAVDYIAGMTDHFCEQIFYRYFDGN